MEECVRDVLNVFVRLCCFVLSVLSFLLLFCSALYWLVLSCVVLCCIFFQSFPPLFAGGKKITRCRFCHDVHISVCGPSTTITPTPHTYTLGAQGSGITHWLCGTPVVVECFHDCTDLFTAKPLCTRWNILYNGCRSHHFVMFLKPRYKNTNTTEHS